MYRVIQPFVFYLDGINPIHFGEGIHDLPERVAEIAISEGWAEITSAAVTPTESDPETALTPRRKKK